MIEKVTLTEALNNNVALLRKLTNTGTSETLNDVNVDDLLDNGRYYLGTGITGANNYTYMIVLKVSYNLTQINYSNALSNVRMRNLHNGAWTEWVTIYP